MMHFDRQYFYNILKKKFTDRILTKCFILFDWNEMLWSIQMILLSKEIIRLKLYQANQWASNIIQIWFRANTLLNWPKKIYRVPIKRYFYVRHPKKPFALIYYIWWLHSPRSFTLLALSLWSLASLYFLWFHFVQIHRTKHVNFVRNVWILYLYF